MNQDDALPIREISRLTGVNTVTLRAWERRYGLLKPQRTGKGHRLYSQEDVNRVKDIQAWLGRGLAISKVGAILANKGQFDEPVKVESVWVDIMQKIRADLLHLQRRPMERLIEELLALYPAEMIADRVIEPLLKELHTGQYSTALHTAFFNTVLIEQLYRVQYRQRHSARQPTILVLSCAPNTNKLLPLLFNYGLLVHGWQAESMDYLSVLDAMACIQIFNIKTLALVGYEDLNAGQVQWIVNLAAKNPNTFVVLVGHIAELYQSSTSVIKSNTIESNIVACATQQEAIEFINNQAQGATP